MTAHRLVLLSILAVIQGCGGGGGGSPNNPPTAPGAFSASVRFDAPGQRFVVTWNASAGADLYRVRIKRDSSAEFTVIGPDPIPSTTLEFTFAVGFAIHWSAAALRVEACNTIGCTAAADLPLLPHLADALARKHVLNVPSDANRQRIVVSGDGNTLVIGAPVEDGDDGQQRDRGVVYVFTRTGTTWGAQPTLLRAPNGEGALPSEAVGDRFGWAVALSEDGATLAVGAPREDGSLASTVDNDNNDAPDAGAVYIFTRNAAAYELQAYLKPTPGAFDTFITGDQFGRSIALAATGQTLVVGAHMAEAGIRPANFNDGAAYVFTREGASWTQRALLGGPHADANADDQFGWQVTMSGDGARLAVGAPFDDEGDAESGAAYVFATTDGVQWQREVRLKAPNAGAEDIFGIAVALSGDGTMLAIGATGEDGDATSTLADDNDNMEGAGAVYVYTRNDGLGWSTTPVYLKPSTTFEAAEFGRELSLTALGNALAIGAPLDASAPPLQGAVFAFVRVGADWHEQVRLDGTASEFGSSIALTRIGLRLFIGAYTETTAVTPGVVHVH